MTVSTRNTILIGAGALAMVAMGSLASAGGGMGGGPVVPGATSGGQGTSYGGGYQSSPCCGKGPKGHGVVVPGVNVAGPNVMVTGSNVMVNQGSVMSSTQSFLNTSVVAEGGGSFVSGGGGYYAPQGIAPSSIGALNVQGGEERYLETIVEKVPSTEEYCAETVTLKQTARAVQAVCLDDKGTPHPASRVDASQHVPGTYQGELFRCMAGTNMQVTLGSVENGAASFAHGQTFACRKGEALVHKHGGDLSCAPQAPQRDCNERSLLRRHGPGIKIVQARVEAKTCIPKSRTVMKSVERQVERTRQTKSLPMVFDGGVGQGVY